MPLYVYGTMTSYYVAPYNTRLLIPTDVSADSLILWLDAADSTTLFLSGSQAVNNGNVDKWKDKSGKGYDANLIWNTGGTKGYGVYSVSNPYMNNKPTIVFNNITTAPTSTSTLFGYSSTVPALTIFPSGSGCTMFCVYDASSVAAGGYYGTGALINIGKDGTEYYPAPLINATRKNRAIGNGSGYGTSITSFDIANYTTPTLWGGVVTGESTAKYYDYLNGNLYANGTGSGYAYDNNNATKLCIGARGDMGTTGIGHVGNISEAIVYNKVLTTLDRQKIEGCLAWKWGFQTSLPTNHPYYGAAPTVTA